MRTLVITDGVVLMLAPEVQAPDGYGDLLSDTIRYNGTSACDLTCGSGLHALRLAAAGIATVAIDRNPDAVALTRRNALLNGLDERVDTRVGDLYHALSEDERFDTLVAWPPVMPCPAEADDDDDWWSLANNGGPDGRSVIDRVIVGATGHLTGRGSLWLAHPWYLDLKVTRKLALSNGLTARVVARGLFELGPTSRARLPYLASLGLRPPRDGARAVQEMVVLELRRSPGAATVGKCP